MDNENKFFDGKFFKGLAVTTIGAFIGASLAFGFGIWLFKYQENKKAEIERTEFLTKLKSEVTYNLFITDDLIRYYKDLKKLDEYNYKLNIGVKDGKSGGSVVKNYKNLFQFNLLLKAFENNMIYEFLSEKEAADLRYSILWNKELNEWISKFWAEKLKDNRKSFDNLSLVVGEHELSLSDMSKQLKLIDSKITIKD